MGSSILYKHSTRLLSNYHLFSSCVATNYCRIELRLVPRFCNVKYFHPSIIINQNNQQKIQQKNKQRNQQKNEEPSSDKKTEPKSVKSVVLHAAYFNSDKKDKDTFLAAIDVFKDRDHQPVKGHIDFIYASLKYMEEFGVHKDLEAYKKLIDLMPKKTMVISNLFQTMFMHYPKHQQCALDVLHKMMRHQVMGDTEMGVLLTNIFGNWGHPVKKYRKWMYWKPKLINASPWALPQILPKEDLELAKLAVNQMCSVDPASRTTILDTINVSDALDFTWIVSGQSIRQRELIEEHPVKEPIKVEGPFGIFIREKLISYFILRSDHTREAPPKEDLDDITSFDAFITGEPTCSSLTIPLSVHQQPDGTIYGVCATGTSSRDSTLSWVRLLQESNPRLSDIPIIFEHDSPVGEIMVINNPQKVLPEGVTF